VEKIILLWDKIPIPIRAIVSGGIVLAVGNVLTTMPIMGNMKLLPGVPWALPATLVVLYVFWKYCRGSGFPALTHDRRKDVTRTTNIAQKVRKSVLLFGVPALIAIVSFRLLMPSLYEVSPPDFGVDLTPFSLLTIWGLLVSVAVSAGVIEEIAFRGFMQKPLEEKYGIVPAVLIVGVVFWLAHLSHAEVTFTHLPFHLLVSILFGFLVYYTKSLLPGIALHAIADVILLSVYHFQKPGFIWKAVIADPVWVGQMTDTVLILAGVFLVSLTGAVFSLVRLRSALF